MNIDQELKEIKNEALSNINKDFLKTAFSCIDLTSLNATDTERRIVNMAEKVNQFSMDYPSLKPMAAICVYPNMVEYVRKTLTNNVRIAAVAGSFPSSMTFLEVKLLEIQMAVAKGADDIDVVLPLWAFLDEKYELCGQEIKEMKAAAGSAHLKVILETGAIADPDLIYQASWIAMEAGADFIKTSTGKMSPAATPEAAIAMCHAIKEYYKKSGRKVGFKPAGGISTAEDAVLYLTIVQNILGEEWMNSSLFRIGASRLANHLLSAIEERELVYF